MGSGLSNPITQIKALVRNPLDPVGAQLGTIAGPHSGVAKLQYYDPLFGSSGALSGFSKTAMPSMYQLGEAYGNRLNVPQTPGAYAGATPSWQPSQAGYPVDEQGHATAAPTPAPKQAPMMGAPDNASEGGLGGVIAPVQYARQAVATQRAQRVGNPWATALGGM